MYTTILFFSLYQFFPVDSLKKNKLMQLYILLKQLPIAALHKIT